MPMKFRILLGSNLKTYTQMNIKCKEMDMFLHALDKKDFKYKEAIKHLNKLKTSNELTVVIKTLTTNKSPETEGFIAEFYWILKVELTLTLFNLFHKIQKEGVLQNSY
jgi:hypothetical protein